MHVPTAHTHIYTHLNTLSICLLLSVNCSLTSNSYTNVDIHKTVRVFKLSFFYHFSPSTCLPVCLPICLFCSQPACLSSPSLFRLRSLAHKFITNWSTSPHQEALAIDDFSPLSSTLAYIFCFSPVGPLYFLLSPYPAYFSPERSPSSPTAGTALKISEAQNPPKHN